MIAWGVTDAGMVRKENQDHHFVEVNQANNMAVMIVCDGMGGAKAGNIASKLAVATVVDDVRQAIKPHMSPKAVARALESAIYHANRVVGEKAKEEPDCRGMGTTLVSAVVSDNTAVIANIGDSRAYLINNNGISRVTRDHSLVEDLLIRGELTEDEAKAHPQKNLITRALGTEVEVACDIYEVVMEPGDFLLLCSDGLTNMLDDQQILFEVIHGGRHADCCQRLTEQSNGRGGLDNITVLLLSL